MNTVELPLTSGYFAIIDEIDLPLVQGYTWWALQSRRGKKIVYAVADIPRQNPQSRGRHATIYLHRLLTGASPTQYVDHKDHNGLNDRRSNLRICTMSQNLANSRSYTSSSSGYRGVSWDKRSNKWSANMTVNGKHRSLGLWSDPWRAAQEYNKAALDTWGEFASLNEPLGGAS